MYLKIVTVKTETRIYHYVRVCERRYCGKHWRKDEVVVTTLGTFEEVKKSVTSLVDGLNRIRTLNLSSIPEVKHPRRQRDKKPRAGTKT